MITHELDETEILAVLKAHLNAKYPNSPVNVAVFTPIHSSPNETIVKPEIKVRAYWDEEVNGRHSRTWTQRFVTLVTMGLK